MLALNNAHARELSWLEPERLRTLIERAFLASRIGNIEAFLLAFDQDADYDSPNFLWFKSRYRRFVYVDRIAVAPEAQAVDRVTGRPRVPNLSARRSEIEPNCTASRKTGSGFSRMAARKRT